MINTTDHITGSAGDLRLFLSNETIPSGVVLNDSEQGFVAQESVAKEHTRIAV